MPPLTSTAGCNGCLRLSQKISELEGRISVLHHIRDDEEMLDSLITMGPAATTTASLDSLITMGPTATRTTGELDSTVPWMGVAARSDHWTVLGTKPKAPVSSSPSQKEPWIDARRGKHCGKLTCRPTPPQALQLTNQFSILDEEDFPPLAGLRPPSTSPRSGVPMPSPPPLCTAASRASERPADRRSRRHTPFSRPGSMSTRSSVPLPSPPPVCTSRLRPVHSPRYNRRPGPDLRAGERRLHTTRPLTTIQLHILICSSGIHKPDQDPQAIASCFTDYW
ncbi:Epsin-2 [Dissostichus eleginoides]|uniref:Epsin-2 n=1 Tax=Dissostichus eleginoides TaxID=100907 RepID=A0AAD9B675_DISEL|nr:Epsin-2 [Dissostichus eleginoides]